MTPPSNTHPLCCYLHCRIQHLKNGTIRMSLPQDLKPSPPTISHFRLPKLMIFSQAPTQQAPQEHFPPPGPKLSWKNRLKVCPESLRSGVSNDHQATWRPSFAAICAFRKAHITRSNVPRCGSKTPKLHLYGMD